jgi:sRNA-binding protein
MMEDSQDFPDWIRQIQRSDEPEIDKLREFFGQITSQIVEYAEREIELARAMQDRDEMVKQQIKRETIKTARALFARGYQIATGRRAWDEQDNR